MRDILTIVGSLVAVTGTIPYLADVIRGKTKPKLVTWVTWSLIHVINIMVTFSNGAWQSGVFSAIALIATLSVIGFGLRHGNKAYSRFDIICQVAALAGIPLWLLSGVPAVATAFAIAVDFSGGLPTLLHAWKSPQEETWHSFALTALGSLIVLMSLSNHSFVAIALPLYICSFDIVLVGTILLQGKRYARLER